jgi:hypothetical protein
MLVSSERAHGGWSQARSLRAGPTRRRTAPEVFDASLWAEARSVSLSAAGQRHALLRVDAQPAVVFVTVTGLLASFGGFSALEQKDAGVRTS